MKKQKWITIILLSFLFISSGCHTKSSDTTEIKLNKNQSILLGQVSAITGNDITLALVEEVDTSQMKRKTSETTSNEAIGNEMAREKNPNEANPRETSFDNIRQQKNMYQATGDTKEMRIPVGTTVTTKLGTKTSFSRIATSDVLKVVVEKNTTGDDIIVAVYIVG